MTDRPIIFSGPMVKALLDGRKTQTRRILKPQPTCHPGLVPSFSWGKFSGLYPDDWFGYGNEIDAGLPYVPGDRLWVREAWHAARSLNTTSPRDIPRDADIEHAATARSYAEIGLKGKLRPSIHMPRWASRLTLIVTNVRVQRLREISEEDAQAEGAKPWTGAQQSYVTDFCKIWSDIHGPGSWLANPWVCAVSFHAIPCNIDSIQIVKASNPVATLPPSATEAPAGSSLAGRGENIGG